MYSTIISAGELHLNIENSNWIICDCRFDILNPSYGGESYQKGHLPHAVYVDLDQDLSAQPDGSNGRHPLPPFHKLLEMIKSLGISNHSQVVAYDDDGGGYAARLWWMLKYLGHERVAVLDGGIQSWIEAGYPLSREKVSRKPGQFQSRVQESRLIQVSNLQEQLGTKELFLLDSRAPERYRGDEEPLDRIGGHIPGAANRYWRQNLKADGKFKSPKALRGEFELLLEGTAVEQAIVYCGSGVTACHNVLALVHAGYPLPRLYAGSWSEWSSDSSRAVATGDEE